MITGIQIKDFQPHKRLDIKIGPGVTTIIGPSDTGKSSFIRAFLWAMTNKPNGHAFIRNGTAKALVKLHLDGHTILRSKSKSTNLYKLDDKEFNAFSNEVPAEIQKLLGIGNVNYSRQHDPPFWFSNTAGEVSRQLNSIVNLGDIDTIMAHIASELRSTRAKLDVVQERLEKAKVQEQELLFVKGMDEKLQEVEKKQQKYDNHIKQTATLQQLIINGVRYQKIKTVAIGVIEGGQIVLKKYIKLNGIQIKAERLDSILYRGQRLEKILGVKVPSLTPLTNMVTKLKQDNDNCDQLLTLILMIRLKGESCEQKKQELQMTEKAIKDEMENLGMCPLCGKPWGK